MTAPVEVVKLVNKFKTNEHMYKSPTYDEENTKVDFINPLFEALGWDISNKHNLAPQYKDVVFEDSIKINGKAKAPDYAFRIGGQKKFFVEAKKPSVDIENDKAPAYQVRRYGWSSKLGLCVLTDFETLSIYETRTKPDRNQSASIGRVKYYHYSDYIDKWDEIRNIISKKAVCYGCFDNFVHDTNSIVDKRGTSPVDDEFLKEIDNWRILLARNIALRNDDLSIEELNYAVQLTIDRIIFFRMAEDRGIERYKTLFNLLDKPGIYKNFAKLCKKADKKYNSGLFHFEQEKDNPLGIDTYTLTLTIDDKIFETIFKNLYYPKCPYEFSVISPEMLGNVYEQFLGQTIRLTKGHQAKVEEKPEVKKAGGVYYTPEYIVKYIIDHTVGKLIEGLSPNKISKLRFIDISCGSGSFLIGAYQKLLDYHLEYYSKYKKYQDKYYESKNGQLRLTINEKKRILLNNIYGVDIDVNAVEVTKLSLLLKVLEDENKDVLEQQQTLYQERALPNLSNNIKCGNSLIGTDILSDLSVEEATKINPFNWKDEFPDIINNGGFDAVIGNPPYFNIDTWGTNSKRKNYIKKHYNTVYQDKTDILFYFISKAIELSKNEIGYIISNAFLFADKGDKLRNFILDNAPMSQIVNFEKYEVFHKASINTCIIFLDKTKTDNIVNACCLSELKYNTNKLTKLLNNSNYYFNIPLNPDDVFPIKPKKILDINNKIDLNKTPLGDLLFIGKGMETGANKIFTFKEYPKQFPNNFVKKRVDVSSIKKYFLPPSKEYVLYVEDVEEFKELPNSIKDYLKSNKQKLSNRADKKRRETAKWWNFNFPLHENLYSLPKIFTNYRNRESKFALDCNNEYLGFTNTTIIFSNNDKINIKYVLSLLNSDLFDFRYKSIGKLATGGSYEFLPNGLSKFCIPEISLEEQKPFIELTNKIINLNIDLFKTKTPNTKRLLEDQIRNIGDNINDLVYKLYDLTEDEIKIIEESLES